MTGNQDKQISKEAYRRFQKWAKDNNYDGSANDFFESNLDALGY